MYDDGDVDREGKEKYTLTNRHSDAINHVAFQPENKLSATASDDGYVSIANLETRKPEGMLAPDLKISLPQVKICRFLDGHNCIVTADLDGYLNFYAVFPSYWRQKQSALLARVTFFNEREQIKYEGGTQGDKTNNLVSFPIRGMDYNPKEMVLYTGDEAGYL